MFLISFIISSNKIYRNQFAVYSLNRCSNLSISPRQTVPHTQCPISQSWIGVFSFQRQPPGSPDQISLQLITVKIRVISPYDPLWCQGIATKNIQMFYKRQIQKAHSLTASFETMSLYLTLLNFPVVHYSQYNF